MTSSPEIERWMVDHVADLLGIRNTEVSVTTPFSDLGLDSTTAVGMTGDLEDWLGIEIDPTACYDFPTISSLAQHLGEVAA